MLFRINVNVTNTKKIATKILSMEDINSTKASYMYGEA